MPSTAHQLAERIWQLPTRSKSVDDAKRFAELAVAYCDAACREATAMAVSEFAENLVKYGTADATLKPATIAISVHDKLIRIRCRNAAQTETDARHVVKTISKIAAAPSAMELYRNRLKELFDNPGLSRAQLGLLRVAFEGGFRLSCKYEPPYIEIVAERTCANSP